MNSRLRILASLALALTLPTLAQALSPEDIARATKILQTVMDVSAKYAAVTGKLTPPTPQTNQAGPYFLPYDSKGELTGWANKAIQAQVGAAVGEKAGEEAGKAALNQVPFGGLLGGSAKKKGKELGAIAAVGGTEFIKSSSDLSFAHLEDFAVYLHTRYSSKTDYPKALATAIAVYPALEKGYLNSLKKAWQAASKEAPAK
jgi:hypothetical protein